MIVSYGVCNIIVHGKPFKWLRTLAKKIHNTIYELITCMMCISAYFGIFMYMIGINPLEQLTSGVFIYNSLITNIITGLLIAGFTSGSVWLIHTIQEYYER